MSRIKVELVLPVAPQEVEGAIDEDITTFGAFFESLGNDPLVRSEKAILKTYFAWKLGLMKSA